jgi:hypothetical protein
MAKHITKQKLINKLITFFPSAEAYSKKLLIAIYGMARYLRIDRIVRAKLYGNLKSRYDTFTREESYLVNFYGIYIRFQMGKKLEISVYSPTVHFPSLPPKFC